MPIPRVTILIAVVCVCLLGWLGSYVYMRFAHSLSGESASAPISWRQINYDEHYVGATTLYFAHLPLAWLDERITRVETSLWKNDFHGDPGNYGREAYN
ncbi:MAG: hypothetical protein MI741_02395 [Rhodospirillales bacterium]|nr:hypothetical protein [Rhodospirillales bacterium]